MTPLERAIWWGEYVARNQGAATLKSPAAHLSWTQYLMLDVVFAIIICILTLFWVIKTLVRRVILTL